MQCPRYQIDAHTRYVYASLRLLCPDGIRQADGFEVSVLYSVPCKALSRRSRRDAARTAR